MGGTSVPAITFTATGFIAPAQSAVLAGVQADLNAVFGGGLNPALNTPQGQLASTETALIGQGNNQFVYFSTQVDPAFAQGIFQDAIGRIYFIDRLPAVPTSVTATCSGGVNVPILTGSLAKATDGNLYVCTAGGVIPASGSIDLQFACVVNGPIACPAGSLSEIYQAIPGWDSITNAAPGVIGNSVETRSEFEARRLQSVALNSIGSIPSVQGSVLQVDNLIDAYTTDNPTSAPVTKGGVTIGANSLYVCVAGGDPQAVANAIWKKKAPGCAYTGNTTETVLDSNSGYSLPYPSYSVTFQTATSTPIKFAVTIANSAAVPSNATALVQAAIIAAFSGADGGPRARIGSTVFASRFYGAVASLGSWAQVVSILIGTSTPTMTSVVVNINQVPTISATNISLTLV